MKHIVINGGGLVGALSAIYMLKHSSNVTVVEKRIDLRTATAETGRSINLIITSRGLFALRAVGLEEKALELCVPVKGRVMHSKDGSTVFQPYGVNPKEVNYSVSRTKLNAMLIGEAEKLGAKFMFEQELQDIDFDTMVATYKPVHGGDAHTMTADFFIGTDGVASNTRTAMLKKLGGDAKVYFQRSGISYKELTFPKKGSEYVMEATGLHIWPRGPHFLMALADKESTFTGTLYLPDGSCDLGIPGIEGVPQFEQLATEKELVDYVTAQYPDVPTLVPDYKEQMMSRPHSMLATVRCSNWYLADKCVLMGDAAHGVIPFFGQGMNLGFESLVVLDRFMKKKDTRAAAFAAYEEFHHANGDSIADMAIENFTEMAYKVGLEEFLHKKAIERAIEARYPNLVRSRYYMVTKTLIPFHTVKAAGPIVDQVIDKIASQMKPDEDPALVSEDVVKAAIAEIATPFFTQHGIEIGNTLKEYYP